jgi:hypothetical protein
MLSCCKTFVHVTDDASSGGRQYDSISTPSTHLFLSAADVTARHVRMMTGVASSESHRLPASDGDVTMHSRQHSGFAGTY